MFVGMCPYIHPCVLWGGHDLVLFNLLCNGQYELVSVGVLGVRGLVGLWLFGGLSVGSLYCLLDCGRGCDYFCYLAVWKYF